MVCLLPALAMHSAPKPRTCRKTIHLLSGQLARPFRTKGFHISHSSSDRPSPFLSGECTCFLSRWHALHPPSWTATAHSSHGAAWLAGNKRGGSISTTASQSNSSKADLLFTCPSLEVYKASPQHAIVGYHSKSWRTTYQNGWKSPMSIHSTKMAGFRLPGNLALLLCFERVSTWPDGQTTQYFIVF